MTRALAPQAADKLAKICGLFSSTAAGERASAALKADAMVRAAGLTWHDIVGTPYGTVRPRISTDWQRMALYCHERRHQLSQWERNFVSAMLHWAGEPSEKQQDRLVTIYARLCCEAAA
jgi:hypothetical protein